MDGGVLHQATADGVIEIVEISLKFFPDLLWYMYNNRSILHYAIENRREKLFNLMIDLMAQNTFAASKLDEEPIWEAVRLPPGEDLNEWLAVNSEISFRTISNSSSCMYKYRWADGITIKKPIEVSAPKYVEYLIDWIEAQLDDESIFPQKLENCESKEAHMNTCFKHFVLFMWVHDLRRIAVLGTLLWRRVETIGFFFYRVLKCWPRLDAWSCRLVPHRSFLRIGRTLLSLDAPRLNARPRLLAAHYAFYEYCLI
ncbi:Uncharacterized protein Fot_55438 [Forsythia ovata]|uniref:Uncharacterized protein n=1 Tax=Forsythia ovata TaxID=205694 RepID=A0ABD1P4T5_9LAMI